MDCESENAKWFSPGRFALFLAALIAICFSGILTGTESFVLRDYTLFGYPLAHFHRECFWRGEWALWNPYNQCGMPFLAQWNTLCLYPLSLVYLLFPVVWGLGLFCVLHLWIGGFGMYWLARDRTVCGFAGCVAGILYAFNGLVQTSLMWPNNIAAFGWLPWVLLLFDRAVKAGGRWIFMAGLAGGVQMLTGAPEIILVTWAIAGFRALATVRPTWKPVRRGAVVAGLTSGLAAAQLFPFLDLLARSGRASGAGGGGWAMAVDGWCHLFVPLYKTVLAPAGFRAQVDQFWTLSYYTGIGGLVLAVMAWRCVDCRREVALWWLIGLGALGLAIGQGGLLYPLLGKILPLELMRYPVKFVIALSVAVPMIAAFGVVAMNRRGRVSGAHGLSEYCVIGFCVAWVAWKIRGWDEFGVLRRDWMDSAMFSISVMALLFLASNARRAFPLRVWGTAFLLICFADLRHHSLPLSPTIAAGLLEPPQQGLDSTGLGGGRTAVTRGVERRLRSGSSPSHEDEITARFHSGLANLNLLGNQPTVGGFYSLNLPYEHETSRRLYQSLGDVHGPLADFMGVRRISVAGSAIGWKERPGTEARVTIGRSPVFLEEEEILRLLASNEFSPRKQVLVPAAKRETIAAEADSTATAIVEEIAVNQMRVRTRASRRVLLVIAETWHPNWTVTIDGESAELLRVNHSFQGLELPAGEHVVRLKYRDRQFVLGGGISLMTLILIACGLRGRKGGKCDEFIEVPRVPDLI